MLVLLLTVALFLAGCAWGIAVLKGASWFVANPWVMWGLFGGSGVCLLAAIAQWWTASRKLTIHFAEWGPGPTSAEFTPVTETVIGFIRNNAIEMQASDQILGALYPGLPKKLRVIYSHGNIKKDRVTVEHGGWLRLPFGNGR